MSAASSWSSHWVWKFRKIASEQISDLLLAQFMWFKENIVTFLLAALCLPVHGTHPHASCSNWDVSYQLILVVNEFHAFHGFDKAAFECALSAWNCWNCKSALVVKLTMEIGHRTCFHPGGFQFGWKPSLQQAQENFAAQFSSGGQWMGIVWDCFFLTDK